MAVKPHDVWWKTVRKFLVASTGVAAQFVALGLLHGTALHWTVAAVAAATALGVYRVPNAILVQLHASLPPEAATPHRRRDGGYGLVELLIGIVVLIIVIWLLFVLIGALSHR